MKRATTILLLFLAYCLQAADVALSDAKLVAANFFERISYVKNDSFIHIPPQNIFGNEFTNARFYVFKKVNENRFIFISGSDAAYPILGYTDATDATVTTPPVQLTGMMKWFNDQIEEIESQGLESTPEISNAWSNLRNSASTNGSRGVSSQVVTPLLTAMWSQSPFYNSLCPTDSRSGQKSVTGCVATAMAQVMKYWNYPTQGSGSHSYTSPYAGNLSANFGGTTYHWANMPNTILASNTDIATLMLHCGISVDMNYGSDESAAYVINSWSNGPATAENALKSYFGYDQSTIRGLLRNHYSSHDWIQMLEFDLGQSRPVIYSGFGSGGHCFVCDGEDANRYFHMNWGWGGGWNGYFELTGLNPANRNYNSNQGAIFGLKPNNFSLHSGMTSNGWMNMRYLSNNAPAGYNLSNNTGYKLETWLINYDSVAFYGQIAAMLLNANYQITDTLAVYNETSGKAVNATYNPLIFNIGALHGIHPGEHYIQLFARKNMSSSWQPVANGFYTNMEYFTFYPEDTLLNLNFNIPCSALWTEPFPLRNHSIDTVGAICIDNISATPFNGKLSADIFDINGHFIKSFHTQNGIYIAAHDTYYPQPFIDSLALSPGNYLLGIRIQPNGSQPKFIPMGNSDWTNPVTVTIVAPPLSEDMYEVNDSESIAANLYPVFINDTAQMEVLGTIHSDNDADYFKVNLSSTDTIQLTMQIKLVQTDSLFTGNVMLRTKKSSEIFYSNAVFSDTVVTLLATNENLVYIDIEPDFRGFLSGYSLQLQAVRIHSTTSGITDEGSLPAIVISPNPTGDILNIQNLTPGVTLVITNVLGETVIKETANAKFKQIDVSKLPSGIYFLNKQKFVKQ